jgi:ubiquinol-cytochrome c reductase cytochrome b subunit
MRTAHALVGTLLLVLACSSSRAQSAKVRGPELFHSKGCIQCHSIGNTGGTKGPHLDAVGKRLKKDQIEHQIMNGSLAMPSFAEALSPDEVHTLVEYLHSCRQDIAIAK